MSKTNDLLDPIIADILIKLKSTPEQRYQDLKNALKISDATLSKKIKLLKAYSIIETNSTKNKTGRNFIVYSLTTIGLKMVEALTNYLKQVGECQQDD